MIEGLATWLVNPWLFIAGIVAVALPILIHLLNRRRFKVVDWAAMDFLLDADKKNRRRVRLENLLLLLLRCLAVLLLGLLLARPFLPTTATAGLLDAAQFERIVLLDDSLSMQARIGNSSAWELARNRLIDLTNSLAQERAGNSLTLLLTSRPDRPVFNAAPLVASTVVEVNAAIERLEAGDGAAALADSLRQVESYLAGQPANMNRVVYVLTDLRQPDWESVDAAESASTQLSSIARLAQSCIVIDAGDDDDRNLAIVELRPEGTLVQGVPSAFDVIVANLGQTAADNVQVQFSAEGAVPIETSIDRLAAGAQSSVRFNFTFLGDEAGGAPGENSGGRESPRLPPRRVKVELKTEQSATADRLAADSIAYFAARLVPGIPALIVDGDPSPEFGRGESFYLRRALAPRGPVPSGVAADVITESEFEALALERNLSQYQVIFLLNNYRLGDKTAENVARLEKWVLAGGGLVLLPGDQIDEQFFNSHYWRDGAGLSPLALASIRGDETEASWATLQVADANHPVLQPFAGQNNPLLENVKVFRWWGANAKRDGDQDVSILARLSDAEDSPAIAEKAYGQGRVVAITMPADADWHNWTSDPSYLLVMQDVVRYLAGNRGSQGLLQVGESIRQPVDLTEYELDVKLTGPRELTANLQAAAPPVSEKQEPAQIWEVTHPAEAQGFYELTLRRREGGSDAALFAANVDPAEGKLRRADRRQLERELAGTNVQIISAAQTQSLSDAGTQTEVWWYLLWSVVAVLSAEQLLGWFFGQRRT